MGTLETLLAQNVHTLLKRARERLLDQGYPMDEVMRICARLKSEMFDKYSLTEGEGVYELDGFYLSAGGQLTGQRYQEIIRDFQVKVEKEGKPLEASDSRKKVIPLAKACDGIVKKYESGKIKKGELKRWCTNFLRTHSIEGKPEYTAEKLMNLVLKTIEKRKSKKLPQR